jgi:hypothetical protein
MTSAQTGLGTRNALVGSSYRYCVLSSRADDFVNSSNYWPFCSKGPSEFGKVQLPQHAKPGGAGVFGLPTGHNSAMRTP